MKPVFVHVLFASWIGSQCLGSPIPAATSTVVIKPSADDGLVRTKTEKPRCLLSLFGLDSYEPPQMPDYNSPTLPDTGFLGQQGGVLSNNNGFGGSNTGIHGSSLGLGRPSQFTPGLGQASDAWKHAQGLESQLYGSQYQINSQLGGVPNSGIPLSPGQGYLRSGPGFGFTSLSPPPTIFY